MSRSASRVRSGCSVCKKRKIKCDEHKPSCLRCIKAGRTCAYDVPRAWIFELPDRSNTSSVSELSKREEQSKAVKKRSSQSSLPPTTLLPAGIPPASFLTAAATIEGPAHFVRIANFALEHFALIIAPSLLKLSKLKDGTNGLVTRLLPWTLSDPLLIHALVAEVISHIMVSTDMVEAMTYYRSSALTGLHKKLQGPVDAAAIQVVMCFLLLDGHLGNKDFVEAHRKGLREMLKMVGIQNLALDGFQYHLIQSVLDTPYEQLEHAAHDPALAWSYPESTSEPAASPDSMKI